MTDHFVGRGTQALRVAVVVERARVGPPFDESIVNVGINLIGCLAGLKKFAGKAQNLGCDLS